MEDRDNTYGSETGNQIHDEISLKECAIKYAQNGIAVFPLREKSKEPATSKGLYAATRDLQQITAWWTENPKYNIGIPTGIANGFIVIDVDIDKEKGKDGKKSITEWQKKNGNLPNNTCISRTGRGGYHFFYKSNQKVGNRNDVVKAVDVRGDGGYIAAPPSIHPNGGSYKWVKDHGIFEIHLLTMDENVKKFVEYRADKKEENKTTGATGTTAGEGKIGEGARTSTLVSLIGSLLAKGLSDEAIKAAVSEENKTKCVPPLSSNELSKQVFPALQNLKERDTASYTDQKFAFPYMTQSNNPRPVIRIDNFRALMKAKGIIYKRDVVKRQVVFNMNLKGEISEDLTREVEIDRLVTLCTEMCIENGFSVPEDKVYRWILLDAAINQFNPITDSLKRYYEQYHGDPGEFDKLMECIRFKSDTDFSILLFKKALWQSVAMAHNDHGFYGADGALTLQGKQGIGKTSLIKMICQCFGKKYFKEGAKYDRNAGKDRIIEMTENFFCELGEAKGSLKEVDEMKAFITNSEDHFRLPFARAAEKYPRYTTFFLTVNDADFLRDQENRRYWTVEVESIERDRVAKLNFEKLWSEVYGWYLDNNQGFRLTNEEQKQLAEKNKEFRALSEEETVLYDCLDWTQPVDDWKEMTATEITQKVFEVSGQRLDTKRIGRALRSMGYDKGKNDKSIRVLHGLSVFRVPDIYLKPGFREAKKNDMPFM